MGRNQVKKEKSVGENAPETVEQAFTRIDAIRSVAEMQIELLTLEDKDLRRKVILHALAHSKFQFTWSFMALQFNISESEWPGRS